MPCTGAGPRECLLVREPSGGAWMLFYDHIEGFTYEPGWYDVLRVSRRAVPNPAADGSSLAYALVQVVSRTPA